VLLDVLLERDGAQRTVEPRARMDLLLSRPMRPFASVTGAGDVGRARRLSNDERRGMSHGRSHDLMVSLRAVDRARAMLDLARTQSALPQGVTSEQQRLLAALEGYAVALTTHGHPMPYRMRSELVMYRAMFNPPRRHIR
jgi:hypothetical protein